MQTRKTLRAWIAVAFAAVIAGVFVMNPTPSRVPRQADGVFLITAANGSRGSGVAIGPRTLLTADHVIEDAADKPVVVGSLTVAPRKGRITFRDPKLDIAVIVVDADLPTWRNLRCKALAYGEPVTIVGYPSISNYSAFGPVMTQGNVASMLQPAGAMHGFGEFLIVTALVQPGNSGGPLFDLSGAVAGLAQAMLGERLTLPQAADADPDDAESVFLPNGYSVVIPATSICPVLGRT